MMWRWLLLVLGVVLFPDLLRAQEETYKFDSFQPNAADSSKYGKMCEDIEIFRRILDRKLAPLYRLHYREYQSAHPANGTEFWAEIIDESSSLEGIYLKGHGVVYTATLSSLQPKWKTVTDSGWEIELNILRPASEWESIRRQLRNEKAEPKKPEAPKPSALSDVLLKVLAENGHNFSQLGENESLTIVLSVREGHSPAPIRTIIRGGPAGPASTLLQTRDSITSSDRRSEVSDRELLGDLHQKQERYREALKAFGEALTREPGPDPKEAARLYRKMTQCYLALGDDEKARKMLDQSINSLKDMKDKPAPPKPAVALPTKLIISAPKKLLDEVKEGKISLEQFRAKAHIETLRFDNRR